MLTKTKERYAYNIEWDTDGISIDDLPEKVGIPEKIEDDKVADYLSDCYGYCVFGFSLSSDVFLEDNGMRDPQRIDNVLSELKDYWIKNPDLRLGQIVCNFGIKKGMSDPFNLEDEDLMKALRAENIRSHQRDKFVKIKEVIKIIDENTFEKNGNVCLNDDITLILEKLPEDAYINFVLDAGTK